MTASASHPLPPAANGTQQLVLVGAGPAHLQMLAQLVAKPLPQTQVVLVTPHASLLVPSMLPGFVAGTYTLDDCSIPLEPMVQRSGIRWIERSVGAIDMVKQTLQLDDGSTLAFDWLSINTGPIQDRRGMEQRMPGAREHGLFTCPAEAFSALWPRVVAMGQERDLRLAVIGEGTDSIELALAIRHRLPTAAVTLLCGPLAPGADHPPAVQQRLQALLKKRRVTVLRDVALSLHAGNLQLGCGAGLACDVPVLAAPTQAPTWLAGSGLALDAEGFPAVDEYLRSTSHSRVFAINGAASAPLDNLASAMAGTALKPSPPTRSSLRVVSSGGRYAVGSWHGFSAQGRWVWWLKHWVDRRQMAQCVRTAP